MREWRAWCSYPASRRPRLRRDGVSARLPRGRPRRDRARCAGRARLRRDGRRRSEPLVGACDVRRLLDGRSPLPATRARPSRPRRAARARERVARYRRPDRARRAARRPTRSSRTTWRRRGVEPLPARLARATAVLDARSRPRPASPTGAAAHTAAELATTLRLLGSGTQEPLWTRLGELRMPVALVTGRADAKFEQINDAMRGRVHIAPESHACISTEVTRCRSSSPDALARRLARLAQRTRY